jgi:hypothetical protein
VSQDESRNDAVSARQPDPPAYEPPDDGNDGFALLQGSAPWARRLTRRAKLLRASVIVGVVALAVSVVAGSTVIAQVIGDRFTAHPPSTLRVVQSFPTFPAQSLHANLPLSAYTAPIALIQLAPGSSRDAGMSPAWACWVTEPLRQTAGGLSVLHAARTLDGGASWLERAVPAVSATGCQIVADQEAPSRALLIAHTNATDGPACQSRLLLTQDDGVTWREIAPSPTVGAGCTASYALQMGAVFVTPAADSATGAPGGVAFWRIDSSGPWTSPDTGQPQLIVTAVVGARPGGRLLGLATMNGAPDSTREMMESADGGTTWRSIGSLPGPHPTLFVGERGQRAPGGPIYAIADGRPQTAGAAPTLALWRWDDANHVWATLPAIPHLPTAPDPLAQPETTVVGVGPDGGLLVSVPDGTSKNEEPAGRALWYWANTARRWVVSETVHPAGAYLFGLGWSGDTATLWLIYLHIGVPPHLELYTTRFTPNTLTLK